MQYDTTIHDCKLLQFPNITDERGQLAFLEGGVHIPFAIKRIFYIHKVPSEAKRGAHAHNTLQQFLICLAGSFTIALTDGSETLEIQLSRSDEGIYIPPLIWGELKDFQANTICLALTSDRYDPSEYINDYHNFKTLKS